LGGPGLRRSFGDGHKDVLFEMLRQVQLKGQPASEAARALVSPGLRFIMHKLLSKRLAWSVYFLTNEDPEASTS
jgi:hypothetical protein